MDKRNILFDMDGVLIDSSEVIENFWAKWAKIHSKSVKHIVKNCHGVKSDTFINRYFSDLTHEQKMEIARDVTDAEAKFSEYKPVNGVLKLIRSLSQNQYRLGLVTSASSDQADDVLKFFSLQNVFDTKVTSNDVSAGKPEPDCYLQAATNLGVHANSCLVFEDSVAGTLAAKHAGMKVIGVLTTHDREELINADYCIDDFSQIDVNWLEQNIF